MLIPVILAGGTGTRLWPVSRAMLPKQFIQFPQQPGSLFQNTLSRLSGFANLADPVVVCNFDHRFLVAEQLRQLDSTRHQILLEPFGRNTAPAVALAAMQIARQDPEAILLVLPSDHLIRNHQAFQHAVSTGMAQAQAGNLVTFGIVPTAPETGYGYIRKGASIDSQVFRIDRFLEKPDLQTAQTLIADGDHLWNSGMFMFSARAILAELERHAPQIHGQCLLTHAALGSEGGFYRIDPALFASCPADSLDYALMEHTRAGVLVPLDAGWNDLGSWGALCDTGAKDESNNVVSGDVLLNAVRDSYIQATSRLVTAVGVSDMVIVETSDAVLVASRQQAQDVKKIVDILRQLGRDEHHSHDLVYRPWGSYESLVRNDGYQVKHIIVRPGGALSLQMHRQRSEHWVVIRGEATVTRDQEVFTLSPNESTFIPMGCRHRLENRGQTPCELIEVQVGDYVGEDDIVRFEDVYGRVQTGR